MPPLCDDGQCFDEGARGSKRLQGDPYSWIGERIGTLCRELTETDRDLVQFSRRAEELPKR
jgi:hypothetical protein